jgi:hypothetical protein
MGITNLKNDVENLLLWRKKDEIFLLMACHVIRKITKNLWYLDTEYRG